jgi:hypothetical protein
MNSSSEFFKCTMTQLWQNTLDKKGYSNSSPETFIDLTCGKWLMNMWTPVTPVQETKLHDTNPIGNYAWCLSLRLLGPPSLWIFIVKLPRSEGCNTILVCMNQLTKMVHFYLTTIQVDAKETVHLYLKYVFKHHGLSNDIVTNQGTNSSWASLNFATFTATNPPHSTRSPMTRRNVLIRSWSNTYKSSVTISKATGWTFSLWPSSHTTMPNTSPPACLHSLQTMAYTLIALSK